MPSVKASRMNSKRTDAGKEAHAGYEPKSCQKKMASSAVFAALWVNFGAVICNK